MIELRVLLFTTSNELMEVHNTNCDGYLLLHRKPPHSIKQQHLFCWWMYNLGKTEADSFPLFHVVLAKPAWRVGAGNRVKPCSLPCLALSRDLCCSWGLEHLLWPSHVAAWLPSSMISEFQGCVHRESDGSCVTTSLCEKLVTKVSMHSNGEELDSFTFSQKCQRICKCMLKLSYHPWRILLKIKFEFDEVSRPNYQFIGCIAGGVC